MPNSLDGLSDAEVQARLERGETNRVLEPASRAGWEIVRANVLTRFNALLGSLFVVILAVGPWQDALFGGVLVINSLIGIIQELRAKRTELSAPPSKSALNTRRPSRPNSICPTVHFGIGGTPLIIGLDTCINAPHGCSADLLS